MKTTTLSQFINPVIESAIAFQAGHSSLTTVVVTQWEAAKKAGVKPLDFKRGIRDGLDEYQVEECFADGTSAKRKCSLAKNTVNQILSRYDKQRGTSIFAERSKGGGRKAETKYTVEQINAAAVSAGLTKAQLKSLIKSLA